jgi:hypothetical protein
LAMSPHQRRAASISVGKLVSFIFFGLSLWSELGKLIVDAYMTVYIL